MHLISTRTQKAGDFSIAPGTVVFAQWVGEGTQDPSPYGRTVIVRHDIGDGYYYYSQYSHLASI